MDDELHDKIPWDLTRLNRISCLHHDERPKNSNQG